MINFFKTYYKTLIFFAVIGLFGGFFTGIFLLDSYPEDMRAELMGEISALGLGDISPDILLGVIIALQAAGYGIFSVLSVLRLQKGSAYGRTSVQ